MRNIRLFGLHLAVLCLMSLSLYAANGEAMKEDNPHVRRWNNFADNIFKLHKELTSQDLFVIKTKMGGYAHLPNFYKQYQYINKKTGKLVSQLQWEKSYPDNLHTIEVYIYDEYGRVSRDYTAAYLPEYRNAPTQTLLSIHRYNGLLHAFRSFDATGDRILDRCTGRYNAKQINILLDEDEIYEGLSERNGVMQSDTYKECFKGLPETAGKYLTPQ